MTLLDALLEFSERNVMAVEKFEEAMHAGASPSTLSTYTAVGDAFFGRLLRYIDLRMSQLEVTRFLKTIIVYVFPENLGCNGYYGARLTTTRGACY